MKRMLSDQDEETRSRSICEQCWLGPLCLAFWAIIIAAIFYGCSAKGAECTLAWNANPATENVTAYRLYHGIDLLIEVPSTVLTATVLLPDSACTIALVAVNASGTSTPATLNLSFITAQQSIDLQAWSAMRSYHTEYLTGPRFYRTRIETPP